MPESEGSLAVPSPMTGTENVGAANIQGLIQITYKNQGGGDSGPMTISWYYGNSPGGGIGGRGKLDP